MKLTFFGAAHAVTGSCHCVECGGKKILVDCGLQQGRGAGQPGPGFQRRIHRRGGGYPRPHRPLRRIPLLVKQGFEGNIYCTRLTASC